MISLLWLAAIGVNENFLEGFSKVGVEDRVYNWIEEAVDVAEPDEE